MIRILISISILFSSVHFLNAQFLTKFDFEASVSRNVTFNKGEFNCYLLTGFESYLSYNYIDESSHPVTNYNFTFGYKLGNSHKISIKYGSMNYGTHLTLYDTTYISYTESREELVSRNEVLRSQFFGLYYTLTKNFDKSKLEFQLGLNREKTKFNDYNRYLIFNGFRKYRYSSGASLRYYRQLIKGMELGISIVDVNYLKALNPSYENPVKLNRYKLDATFEPHAIGIEVSVRKSL